MSSGIGNDGQNQNNAHNNVVGNGDPTELLQGLLLHNEVERVDATHAVTHVLQEAFRAVQTLTMMTCLSYVRPMNEAEETATYTDKRKFRLVTSVNGSDAQTAMATAWAFVMIYLKLEDAKLVLGKISQMHDKFKPLSFDTLEKFLVTTRKIIHVVQDFKKNRETFKTLVFYGNDGKIHVTTKAKKAESKIESEVCNRIVLWVDELKYLFMMAYAKTHFTDSPTRAKIEASVPNAWSRLTAAELTDFGAKKRAPDARAKPAASNGHDEPPAKKARRKADDDDSTDDGFDKTGKKTPVEFVAFRV